MVRSPKRRVTLWVLIGVLSITLLLGFATWKHVSSWVALSMLPPEEKAALRTFETKPIWFPSDWNQVERIDRDTLTSLTRLCKAMELHDDRRKEVEKAWITGLSTGSSIPPEDFTSISASLKADETWAQQFAEVAATKGYNIELLFGWPGMDGVPNGGLAVLQAARLLTLRGYTDQRDGNTTAAMQDAFAILRLSQRAPASPVIAHLVGIAIQQYAVDLIHNLATQLNDGMLLHELLQNLQAHAKERYPMVLDRADILANVSNVRGLKRNGRAGDLTPGKPEYFYQKQWSAYMMSAEPAKQSLRDYQVSRLVNYVLFRDISRPNVSEAFARERNGKARYDLLCLELATRTAQLEHPSARADMTTDLVPKYLQTVPLDPFTSSTYRRSNGLSSYYSMGIDCKDQQGTLPYDVTNGTFSAGDIVLDTPHVER